MLMAVIFSIFMLPIFGKLCDIIDPRGIVPFAAAFRIFFVILFCYLPAPDTWTAYFVCVLMILATIAMTVSCDSLFMKNVNAEVRGLLNGIYSFIGQLGVLIFTLVSGYLYDEYGPTSPFKFLAFLDALFMIIFICFICQESQPSSDDDDLVFEQINEYDPPSKDGIQ